MFLSNNHNISKYSETAESKDQLLLDLKFALYFSFNS